MVRVSVRNGVLPALAFAVAVLACAAPARVAAQVTHANSGDARSQDALASDPALAVSEARKTVADGHLDLAVKTLALYVAAHPREVEPARYLGDLYYRQSDLASAERTFLAILRYAPEDRETHNRLGGVYAAQDRIADAIDEFQKSIPSVGAYPHLVELHMRRGDIAIWESDLRRDAREKPFDAAAQFALGQVLRYERKPIEATTYLERARALAPESCEVLSELGSSYLDLARVADAVTVLERCLALRHNDYSALVNLGDAYIDRGTPDQARTLFERANTVRPDGAEALIDLGYLEDASQRWESAVRYYLHALALDPLAREGYVDLGCAYRDHHLYALAEASFLKGLSVTPNDGRLHYLLGTTYADQGKSVLAKSEYKLALSSDEPEVARAAGRDLAALQK
jgi:tetratricopeptide (TPR) repeat protein